MRTDGYQPILGGERDVSDTQDKPRKFTALLSEEAKAALDRMSSSQRFSAGEMILDEEDTSTSVYLVKEGKARAILYSEDGKMVSFRDIGVGEIFGELAAIDGQPRSASISAVDDLTVGVLTHDQFAKLIETAPDFTWALLRHLASQARTMTERIFEFSTMVVRRRLVHELLRLADASDRNEGAAIITPALTGLDLAVRISTHREAVSRVLSQWDKQGIIVREGGQLLLTDIARLRQSAEN